MASGGRKSKPGVKRAPLGFTSSSPRAKKRVSRGSLKRVVDPLVPIRGDRPPNTSAFKAPARAPESLERLDPGARKRLVTRLIPRPVPLPPEDILRALSALEPGVKRFHGVKIPLYWFPGPLIWSPCADKYGYMFSASVRNASKLPFTVAMQALLNQLGGMMGDPGRDTGPDSTIPAGYTYFGQFVDHDITFDTSSSKASWNLSRCDHSRVVGSAAWTRSANAPSLTA